MKLATSDSFWEDKKLSLSTTWGEPVLVGCARSYSLSAALSFQWIFFSATSQALLAVSLLSSLGETQERRKVHQSPLQGISLDRGTQSPSLRGLLSGDPGAFQSLWGRRAALRPVSTRISSPAEPPSNTWVSWKWPAQHELTGFQMLPWFSDPLVFGTFVSLVIFPFLLRLGCAGRTECDIWAEDRWGSRHDSPRHDKEQQAAHPEQLPPLSEQLPPESQRGGQVTGVRSSLCAKQVQAQMLVGTDNTSVHTGTYV